MKRKIACIAAIGVLASLACITGSAGADTEYFYNSDYGYSFTLSSTLVAPAPNYTSQYGSYITPDYQDGGYVHTMRQTINGSTRNWSHNEASYYLSRAGISYVRDTGSYRGYGATTEVWL